MSGLSLTEQLSLVAQSAHAEWQSALMWVSLAALAALCTVLAVRAFGRAAAAYAAKTRRAGRIGRIGAAAATLAAILYGGTKPSVSHLWRFEYSNGVADNGSYCTNDQIRAAWTYQTAAMEYTLRAAYQDLTVTNANGVCTDTLHQLADALVRDGSHVWTVANATNMRVVVYAQYVPPPSVQTNGIYHLNGVMRTLDTTNAPLPKYVTPGVQIHVNLETGETRILTPTNKPPASLLTSLTPNP